MLKSMPKSGFPPLAIVAEIPTDRAGASRARLFDRLDAFWQQSDQRLLVVRAGPGYGKTTLLADWVAQAQVPAAWHTLTPADRDPSTLVAHLINAVEQRFPLCGKAAREWLRLLGSEPETPRAAAALAAGLGASSEPRLLILDDVQIVDGIPAVEELLNVLLRCFPRPVRLVLSGRSACSLSHLDLAACGGMLVLSEAELCLTDDEIAEVWRRSTELPVSEEVFPLLARQCAGWAQGALLWAQAGGVTDPFLAPAPPAVDALRSYFQQQVLAFCSPDEQNLMKAACLLEVMSGPLCDTLLEREGSAAVLASLERRGLFLTHLGAGHYRFHPLFRAFLFGEVGRSNGLFARLRDRADRLCRQQALVINMVRRSYLAVQGTLPAQELLWALVGQLMGEQAALKEPRSPAEEQNEATGPEAAAAGRKQSPPGVDAGPVSRTEETNQDKTAEQTQQVRPSSPLRACGFGPGEVWRMESGKPAAESSASPEGTPIPLSEWKYRYPRELFFYVIDHRQTTNEKIACALWPEAEKKKLRHLLGQATSRARKAVGGQFAFREQGRYEWNWDFSYEYDVAEFEALLKDAARMKDDNPEALDCLERAIDLSQGGEFLQSMKGEWVEERRRDLKRQRRQALLRLIRLLLVRQDLKAAPYCEGLLREEPCLEEAIVGRLRCYLLAEERGLARQFYRECVQHFRQEFGTELPAAVRALYREIRGNG